MNGRRSVFDQPHAMALAVAKAECLRELLPGLAAKANLHTALDVGCGLGDFPGLLRELGFTVRAIGVRPENIAEARVRYPDVQFQVYDIEDTSVADLGEFDAVLCLGLLYHLENPFLAVRNLFALTRKVCVIETMIAPYASPLTALVEEGEGEDQGRRHLAQIPSEAWLLKALSKAGFPFIYRLLNLPRHADFRSLVYRKRRRTFLVASKLGLALGAMKTVAEPKVTGRFMWYLFGIGKLLDHPPVRNALKAGLRRIRGRPNSRRHRVS